MILCIEDDREAAEIIREEMMDRGFDIHVEHDGHSGLAAILRQRPSLVLSDIGMPLLSGFDILERLNGLAPRFSDIPFIFLTALGDRASELKGRQLGADDYISKPIDFDILEAIVRKRLMRAGQTAAEPLADCDLNEREIETLTWSARGKTSDEIASILGISKRTVDFHIDNARLKLGVTTRIQAAVKATVHRLIEP